MERAREQANEFGRSFLREVAFLTAHSMLHLLGYDHVDDKEGEEIMCEKQVSVDSRTKIYIETALINYANSGNCDIMYIPRCVGMVIICRIKACSRYNVLSAAVPGPKAPKAGRSPARDRQTEGAQPGVLQSTPAKCRTSAVPLFTQKGKVVTLKGG